MPRKRLDNDTTVKIKKQIVKPAQYLGDQEFPVDAEGLIIPGKYVMEYYVTFEGVTYRKRKPFVIFPPTPPPTSNLPTVTKVITIEDVDNFPTIEHLSYLSDIPTFWNDSTITLTGKSAKFEKYEDEVLVQTVDLTNQITIDRTLLDAALRPDLTLVAGNHDVLFEINYTDDDGITHYEFEKQVVKVGEFITPSCVDPRDGSVLTPTHQDYDIVCGSATRWSLEWTPRTLDRINVIISDPHNPAVFPTLEEMQHAGVKPILIDLLENQQYELQYIERGPTPAFPNEMYTRPTSRTYEYEAINLTVDNQILLKAHELKVLGTILKRTISFISPEMRPLIQRKILWEPANIENSIIFKDHETGSVPSANDLMNGVRAYYIDEYGVEKDLPVTLTRPEKASFNPPVPPWFHTNGEIKTHIPSTWNIHYSANLPASSSLTERYSGDASRKTKKLIIEDTVGPEIVANNGNPWRPTHVELGTSYNNFLDLWDPTCIGFRCRPKIYALDKPRFTFSFGQAPLYPFKFFPVTFKVYHATENREITEEEFNNLEHNDDLRIYASATDDSGNKTEEFFTIPCLDTTNPSLALTGLSMEKSTSTPDASFFTNGVTTFDLSEPVNVVYDISGINFNTPGFYSIPYTATDSAGNATSKNRTLSITGTPPPPSPAVSLSSVVADTQAKAFPVNFSKAASELYYEWTLDGTVVVSATKGADTFLAPVGSNNDVLEVLVHEQPTFAGSLESATNSVTVGTAPVPAPCGNIVSEPLSLNGTENISIFTDADWTQNLITRDSEGNVVAVDYVVHDISKYWISVNATNPDGTMIYSGVGDTGYTINVDVFFQGTFVHCVSQRIEIVDEIAPIMTIPNDPIVINVTAASTVTTVENELKTILSVTDDFSSFANITFGIVGLLSSEIDQEGTYTKTARAEDESGNVSTLEVTFQLVRSDSDGDGIGDVRDQFPNDPLYTTDIDGDGVGDDDSVVIWHHDFEGTLDYLSIQESLINENATLSDENTFEDAIILTAPTNAQKTAIKVLNSDFNIQTNRVANQQNNLENTSLSFSLALNNGFLLDNTETGMFINFQGYGNVDSTNSRLEIKIKKLEHTSTGEVTYRFSIFHVRENIYVGNSHQTTGAANNIFDGSRYINPTNSAATYYNITDLSDYTVLNDIGAGELYGGDTTGYEIGHYITNFDIPLDGKLHSYTFCFKNRTDGLAGREIIYYVDGDVKQILVKNWTQNFGFYHNPVNYNLHGFDEMFLSDYIWARKTDAADIVAIHNKMLDANFTIPSIFGDSDGDGLTDIQEDLLGSEFDKNNPNTDASLIAGHGDGLDDFVEHHISEFITPLSNTGVIGGRSFTKQNASVEDFSQDEFVNYFNGYIGIGDNHFLRQDYQTDAQTISFWWYNDGTLPTNGSVFYDQHAGGWPGLYYNASYFGTKNYGISTSGVGSTPNFAQIQNDHATTSGAEWKLFTAVFDLVNREAKIYINAVLFDTVSNYRGGGSKRFLGSFSKWTDLASWNSVALTQAKIQQLYDRGKSGEYDLRNKYPVIVTDTTPLLTGYGQHTIDTEYLDADLLGGLSFATYAEQEPINSIVNKYQLDTATSNTGSTPGIHEIVVETTTAEGIKIYTRREVFVSSPLQGFLEELPFMDTPAGSATFSALTYDSMIPADGNNSVTVPFPDRGRSANGDFTLSMWVPKTGGGSTMSGGTAVWFKISSSTSTIAQINIGSWRQLGSSGVLRGGGQGWDNVGLGNVAHLVWVISSNDNKSRYYINGSLVSTINTTPDDMQTATEVFISNVPNPMARPVDSVDVLGGALTAEQVLDIYNAGQGKKFLSEATLSITLIGENNMCVFDDTDDPGVTVIDIIEGPITNWVSDWDSITSTATSGFYTITYTATNSAGHSIQTTRQIEFYSSFDLVPTFANLEEEYDDNGVVTAVTVNTTGRLVNGMFLDTAPGGGSVEGPYDDDYIWSSTEDQYSFSCYYRVNGDSIINNGSLQLFYAFRDVPGTTNGDNGWMFYTQRSGTSNQFRLILKYGRSGILYSDYFTVNQHEFNHAAFTYDNQVLKLYHNAELVYENTAFTTLFGPPSTGIYLIGNGNIKGAIDQVEIYKSVVLEKCDILYLTNLRGSKDSQFLTNQTQLEDSFPVVSSLNLEEEYSDNGVMTPTTISGFGRLINGIYFDTSVNNGSVEGVYDSDLYQWHEPGEKFSVSAYYRFIGPVAENESLQLFYAFRDVPGTTLGDNGWMFYIQRHGISNQARLILKYNRDGILYSDFFTIDQEVFNHAAFTYFNGTLRIYQNANLVYENTSFYTLFGPPSTGIYNIGNGSAKGAVDQVEIFRGTEFDQQTLDNYADPTVLQSKNTTLSNNLSSYENSLTVVSSLNLEEEYSDNGVMTPTTISGFGRLINGIYFDTSVNNGSVEGVYDSDLYQWHEPGEKFSVSAYYRFIGPVAENESLQLFYAFRDVPGTTLGDNGWMFYIQRHGISNQARLILKYNRDGILYSDFFTIDQEVFNHAAFTYFNGTLRIYQNANLVYENTSFYTLFGPPSTGIYNIGNGSAKGAVDQVEIFRGTEFDQQTLDNYADPTVLQGKDTEYLNSFAANEAANPVVSSLNLEEEYDDNGVMTPTTINGFGQLINGMYLDTSRNNGEVQGVFNNDSHKWHEPGEKFSFSGYYRFIEDYPQSNEEILLFDAWYDLPNSAVDSGWRIGVQRNGTTNQIRIRLLYNRANRIDTAWFTVNQNEFYHLAMVYSNGTLKFYNNGALIYENTAFYTLFSSPSTGIYKIGNGGSKCAVDQVEIFRGTEFDQQALDDRSNSTVLQNKDAAFLSNLATYQSNLLVVNSLNLEEEYNDNGVMTAVTINGGGSLVNGVYTDSSVSNGNVQGVWSENYKWHVPGEKFSFSAYYKFSNSDVQSGETIGIFDAWYDLPNSAMDSGWNISIQRNGTTNQIRIRLLYNRAKRIDTAWFTVNQQELNSLVLTYDNGTLKLYNNAVEMYSNIQFYELFSNPSDGVYYIGNGSAKCEIDQVNIYRGKLLTQEEIQALSDVEYYTAMPLILSPTLNNGATLTDGVIEFDQSQGSYASLPTSTAYEVGGTDTTIHFWMHPTSNTFTGGETQILVGKTNDGDPNWAGYVIAFGAQAHPSLPSGDTGIKIFSCHGNGCNASNNNTIFRVTGGVPLNQWHHVAVTYNSSNNVHECFFNGTSLGTWTKELPASTDRDLRIGGGGVEYPLSFDGKMKKINIVKSILTPQEIEDIYNEG